MTKTSEIKRNRDGSYTYKTRVFIVDQYSSVYEVKARQNEFMGKLNGRSSKKAIADMLDEELFA